MVLDVATVRRMDIRMELMRWFTFDRIARSDFMRLVRGEVAEGTWTAKEAQDLAYSALLGFGSGSCYFLASVVADAKGMAVVGFHRRTGDERLVHAVVLDVADGHACDILGRRPLPDVRAELTGAVGPLRTTMLPPIRFGTDDVDMKTLLDIAAGLPWMGLDRRVPSRHEWGELIVAYLSRPRS